MTLTETAAERDARIKRIYAPGDLLTVRRGMELVRSFVKRDEEDDLYLSYVGHLTNGQVAALAQPGEKFGTIFDEGWNVVAVVRAETVRSGG